MLQALTFHAQGHRPTARQALVRALARRPNQTARAALPRRRAPHRRSCWVTPPTTGSPTTPLTACSTSPHLPTGNPAPSGQPARPTSAESLSERELQVLRLLGSELTGPQIARELFVSHNTVRTHTKHIFTKLDVTTRRAAVRRAHERGLL